MTFVFRMTTVKDADVVLESGPHAIPTTVTLGHRRSGKVRYHV
jgi:hypothetical protein